MIPLTSSGSAAAAGAALEELDEDEDETAAAGADVAEADAGIEVGAAMGVACMAETGAGEISTGALGEWKIIGAVGRVGPCGTANGDAPREAIIAVSSLPCSKA